MAINNNNPVRVVQDYQGLQDLLKDSKLDDNIRGRKLPDGSIQLYTKASGTSRFGFLSKLASSESRALGREGIKEIFKQHAQQTGTVMTSTVRKAVDPGFARDVKAGALSLLATANKAKQAEAARPEFQGRTVTSLGVSASVLHAAIGDAVANLNNTNATDIAAALGKKLGEAAMASSPDAARRDAFSLSTGDAFKAELNEAFGDIGCKRGDEFLDVAFKAAAYGVARNRLEENGDLRIDDQIYRKQSHLGKGGGGTVDAYARADDPADRIAFKVSKETGSDSKISMLKEIKNHEVAQGGGHANVLNSKGGICLPDGSVGMAMELCPLGDMDDAMTFLDEAVARGDIQPSEAFDGKITLLHDSMKGMVAVEGNGLEHRDYKPANVFIDGSGTARVADFGIAETTNDNRWQADGAVTPFYASPEAYDFGETKRSTAMSLTGLDRTAKNKIDPTKMFSEAKAIPREPGSQAMDVKSSGKSPMRAAMDETLRKQIPNLSKKDREALIDQHNQAFADTVATGSLKMNKRDAFAVGATGFVVLHGTDIGRGAHPVDFYNRLAKNPDRELVDTGSLAGTGADGRASGEQRLGRLVNEMTTFDPSKRKDIKGALEDDLFKSPSVGAPKTRDVIKSAITGGMERKAAAKAKAADEAAARKAAAKEVAASPAFANGAQTSGVTIARAAPPQSLAEQLQAQLDDRHRFMTR